MLTQIDLQHFKCFELLKLPLRPLTLLSGTNASGKSSILQALVLLHQTMLEQEWSESLLLNGASVRLGTVADVIDKIHGRRTFKIGLTDDTTMYQWQFEGDRNDLSMNVKQIRIDDVEHLCDDSLRSLHYLLPSDLSESKNRDRLAERLLRLAYLTAERVGPREIYPLNAPQITPAVGTKGEYAISILYSGIETQVLDGLALDNEPPTRLHQVAARMRKFFPGCELSVEKVPRANAVTLGLRTSKDMAYHRPVHTGFGLTQVLPIVVAALSAAQDDLLLLENPEVHLHPAGQAAIGSFLAEVAAAGVQVILETHSDHVLNGIRRAVKESVLPAESAMLHFLRARQDDVSERLPQVESPLLDANGNIDRWPQGFFDQFDRDMSYFAGWS